MEIIVNIPKNDYVRPMQVRQEVVQYICEAFLSNYVWNTFYPYSENPFRKRTLYVRVSNDNKGWGFENEEDNNTIRFNGAEMKAAFQALIQAGYHMFRIYEHKTWLAYICSKKSFYKDGTEVTEFKDFID